MAPNAWYVIHFCSFFGLTASSNSNLRFYPFRFSLDNWFGHILTHFIVRKCNNCWPIIALIESNLAIDKIPNCRYPLSGPVLLGLQITIDYCMLVLIYIDSHWLIDKIDCYKFREIERYSRRANCANMLYCTTYARQLGICAYQNGYRTYLLIYLIQLQPYLLVFKRELISVMQ